MFVSVINIMKYSTLSSDYDRHSLLLQTFLLLDEEKEQIKDLRLHRTVSYRNEPYADWVIDIDHMTARWPAVHTGERKRFQKRRIRDSTSSTKSLLHEVSGFGCALLMK